MLRLIIVRSHPKPSIWAASGSFAAWQRRGSPTYRQGHGLGLVYRCDAGVNVQSMFAFYQSEALPGGVQAGNESLATG